MSYERFAMVVNPAAGRGRGNEAATRVTNALIASGASVERFDTTGPGDVDACWDAALATAPQAAIVVGGDGSVHHAAQRLATTGMPLAVIAGGTGNDFVRSSGLAAEVEEAVATILGGQVGEVDLLRATSNDTSIWVTTIMAGGFDAMVNERANRMRFLHGSNRYTAATLAVLRQFRPLRYRIRIDNDEPFETDAMLVAVGNSATYGGGLHMCHGADVTDGLLDVTVILPVTRVTLLRMFAKVGKGTHVDHPAVRAFQGRRVRIEGAVLTAYADGERFADLPVDVEVVPGALTVFCPAP